MPQITQKEVEAGDEATFFQLFASVRSEELGMDGWPAELREQTLRLQFNIQRRGYRDQHPGLDERLILCGGSPVGWVIADRHSGPELHGIDIALVAQARRQGVGAAVMRGLLAEAAAENRPMVIVVERRNTRALAFYRRLGFRTLAENEMHATLEWRQDPPS